MFECVALQGGRSNLDVALDGLCFGIQFNGNCYPVTEHIRPMDLSQAGSQVILAICLDPDKNTIKPFHVDGKGQIVGARPADCSNENIIFFQTRVSLESSAKMHGLASYLAQQGKQPKLFTRYPNNNIWFAVLNSIGKISVWCFSLVAQNGKFFAVIEKIANYQAYWDGENEKVVFPGCQWLEFQAKILEPAFEDWDMESDGILLDIAELVDFSRLDRTIAGTIVSCFPQDNVAIVHWYNICKGWGVALLPDGSEARVHWENILPPEESGLRYLKPRDVITFEKIGDPKHTTKRPTGFQYELFGIKKVS